MPEIRAALAAGDITMDDITRELAVYLPHPDYVQRVVNAINFNYERFWQSVRAQFLMPPAFAVLNAANLCPSPCGVEAPSKARGRARPPPCIACTRWLGGRAAADARAGAPEEIVITRNTSEANNFVSSGVDLKAGDEVLIFSDNHPSNHVAWREKAKRFGYTVRTIDQLNPHPGAEYYIDAFTRAMTPATKVVAFTHVTASVGDLMPAREICRAARERGILSLVDGAQSFGVLDVDLSAMQPDFYTGSAHKWPCGPKETGVLYVNQRSHARISPSVVSLYPGSVGISRTLEAFGQRDEPGIMGFGEALAFQAKIGRKAIEERARALTAMLIDGLRKIDGVKIWTHAAPDRSAAIVSFQPATLDPQAARRVIRQDASVRHARRRDRGAAVLAATTRMPKSSAQRRRRELRPQRRLTSDAFRGGGPQPIDPLPGAGA
jgi:selenocysteine lyase/cysteine desulfurase